MFTSIQSLLDRMRPKVQGKNNKFSARFRTSDVLQEAAIQLIGKGKKQEDEKEPPQVWLDMVGQGTAASMRRQHSAAKRSCVRDREVNDNTLYANQPCTSEVASSKELFEELVRCLTRLNAEDQEIVDRYFARQESFNSIAAHMEIPPHQVRRRYKKIMAQLKSFIDEAQ